MGGQLFLYHPQVCLVRYQLIGVNHKSAPLEVRERLAIPESQLPDTCRDLTAYPGIEEGMVISTCNRVEVVTHTTNGAANLRGFLHDRFHLTSQELDPHVYEFHNKDAVRHIFRVASSLDSMVVGEAQILGQVKEAYAMARAVGAVRGQLDQLFNRAFAVAKRVRSETAVGSSSVSIASVAVDLAKKIFGSLEGKTVFVVGAGKMSELAARHLIAHGCAAIFVANRTYERAIGLAQKFNGQAIKFDDLYSNCDRADIVITSTGAPHAIFRREHGEQFLARRKNRPMFFIDIAVPRDVSPDMGKLDGIFIYDIDDLQQAVSSHVADRRKEAERAEAIIASEVERFEARLHTLDVVPTIVSLQDHLETIRQAEIDRVRGRLGQMTPDQEIAVDALTRGIINKVMHTPITTLKSAAKEAEATTVIDVVRRLFNLPGKERDPASQLARPDAADTTSPTKKDAVESRH
jgi:glutamyl-tRNA reductase